MTITSKTAYFKMTATVLVASMLSAISACASIPAQGALPAASTAAAPVIQPEAPIAAPYTLPALPYAYDALASVIDAQTMELHHQRHHNAQVAALNSAIAANPALAGLTLEQLLSRTSVVPAAVRNNAGGHWNHSFFWTIMAPAGQGGTPSAVLNATIIRDFGSMEAFKAQFRAASLGRFGSG